jgi:hypothetical protein
MVGFIRRGAKTETDLILVGPDQNTLLDRRVVAYDAGETQTKKTGAADDLMKEVVDENLGGSCVDSNRDWSSLGFSIAPDDSLGPTLTNFEFAWEPVTKVLLAMSKAAKQEGTRVFFGVVPIPSTTPRVGAELQFRTWIGQPGADRTDKTVFTVNNGLINPAIEYDYLNEYTYIYAGGEGEGSSKNVREKSDDDRIALSSFGRIELFRNAVKQTEDEGVDAQANAILSKGEPTVRFAGGLTGTGVSSYGIDWYFGDLIRAEFEEIQQTCMVSAVMLGVSDAGEQITGSLEVYY